MDWENLKGRLLAAKRIGDNEVAVNAMDLIDAVNEVRQLRISANVLAAEVQVCEKYGAALKDAIRALVEAGDALMTAVTFGPESDLPNGTGRGYMARVPIGFVCRWAEAKRRLLTERSPGSSGTGCG